MTDRARVPDAPSLPPSPRPPEETGRTTPDVTPELSSALAEDDQRSSAPETRPEPDAAKTDQPDPDSITLPPERAQHILAGEYNGARDEYGGGHRSGTGFPEKTEFPADWTDGRTLDHIADVARNPDHDPVQQSNDRWRYEGVRDGVHITVVVDPDGAIRTAWPREGDPGVVKNPPRA